MSVLFEVIDRMMADFFSKEQQWMEYDRRGGEGAYDARVLQPERPVITLDTPEFRQLLKELQESVWFHGKDGIASYKRRVLPDGNAVVGVDTPDATLRRTTFATVMYPYPASKYLYNASVGHNCTLPVEQETQLERLTRFRFESAEMTRQGAPVNQLPGYRRNSCNCADCRFIALEDRRVTETVLPPQQPQLSDDYTFLRSWTLSEVASPPTPINPAPAPSHPNDPSHRMPRLSDGRSGTSVEAQAAILREVWGSNIRGRFL